MAEKTVFERDRGTPGWAIPLWVLWYRWTKLYRGYEDMRLQARKEREKCQQKK